jgi:putative heme iron utilization protein
MSQTQDHSPENPDDPVSANAGPAIAHLNADHDDALLDMARALGGCPEATAARCLDADRFGLTLLATTESGELTIRVPYDEPIDDAEGLRKATVKLAMRAREELPSE